MITSVGEKRNPWSLEPCCSNWETLNPGFSSCEGFIISNYLYTTGCRLESRFENALCLLEMYSFGNIWIPSFVSPDMILKCLLIHLFSQLFHPAIRYYSPGKTTQTFSWFLCNSFSQSILIPYFIHIISWLQRILFNNT